jgi:non-specific serine/threonine protein kinase/serine/threonine-protein kinase
MTPERWQQVRGVFDKAISAPERERSAVLDAACSGDAELRVEVESLLLSHQQAGTLFLERSLVDVKTAATDSGETRTRIGSRVGVYQLLEEIGHGGMGEVYRAERADGQYAKEVAIKLVRVGLDTASVLERFRNERQVLASLDHPNIGRLYDGGTTEDGVPYLVMELIEGVPINQYCDAHHLSIAERLALFIQVCSAVQYAHQRLVIHRDLKPGNVLVTPNGVPKLLDFGIAKILDPVGPAETTLLHPMTPEYASPEQIRGETVTTATDVYSLGVVLYRLLTGRSPYSENTRSPLEFQRVVCDVAPLRPSTVVSGNLNPPALGPESGSRLQLQRALRGDLDNIVLKALRKEPERRYVSVEQFAEDIRHYLQGLPVTATPDSVLYRVSKFVRRHRVGIVAASLVLVAVVGGALATLRQARIAAANARRAEKRFMDVRTLANSLLFEIHDSIQDLPGSIPARKLLVESALRYLDDLAKESANDPSLQRELAIAYKRVGDVQGYPFRANLGDTSGALKSYTKALAIEETLAKARPDSVADALDLASVYRRLAETESVSGNMTGALLEGQRAVEVGEALSKKHPDDRKVQEELIRDYETLAGVVGGNATANLGDAASALDLHRKGVGIAEKLVAANPTDQSLQRLLASGLLRTGDQLLLTGNRSEAEKLYLRGQEILVALASPNNATSQQDLAEVYSRLGNTQLAGGALQTAKNSYAQGLAIYKNLSQASPSDVNVLLGLELAYMNMGDAESRIGQGTQGLADLQTAQNLADHLASTSPTTEIRNDQAVALVTKGEALAKTGSTGAALRSYREALAIFIKLNTEDPSNVDSQLCLAATYDKVGEILLRMKDVAQATEAFRMALKLTQPNANTANAQVASVMADSYAGLGDAMLLRASTKGLSKAVQTKRLLDAESFYEQSLQTWKGVHEPGIVSPDGFESVPPAVVTDRLAHCQKILKQLGSEQGRG